MGAEEITQVDQVAEVLARVAGEEHGCQVEDDYGRLLSCAKCIQLGRAQAAALVAAGLVVEGTEAEEDPLAELLTGILNRLDALEAGEL